MKYLIILLALLLWSLTGNSTFPADNHSRQIYINGYFSQDKICLLQNLNYDTLILDRVEVVYQLHLEWGVFFPRRYTAPYHRNIYYCVRVGDPNRLSVDRYYDDILQQTGPYVYDPCSITYALFGLFLAIHFYVFWKLRKLLIWFHRNDSYYTKRHERRNSVRAILVTVLITILIGWLTHTYFFLLLPFGYLILLFVSPNRWYSRRNKIES